MNMISQNIQSQLDTMTIEQRDSFAEVTKGLAQLNQFICAAVNNGLSIELHRSSRHHADGGYWGDIMMPCIVKQAEPT